MWLQTEDRQPKVKWRQEYDAAKTCDSAAWLRLGEKLLYDKKRKCGNCQHKPDVEIEQEISDVIVPRLSSINLWSSSWATEYVIEDNVERNHNESSVEEARN